LAYLLVLPGSRARIVRCGGRYDPQLVKRSSEWVSECVAVFPVPTPTKTSNEVIYFISVLYIVPFQFSDEFISRVSILMRNIDIAILSVRLSVRPSRSGILWKQLNICHNFFTTLPPNPSSFTNIKHFREIPTGSHSAGWGIKISRFSTNKLLYLVNCTR